MAPQGPDASDAGLEHGDDQDIAALDRDVHAWQPIGQPDTVSHWEHMGDPNSVVEQVLDVLETIVDAWKSIDDCAGRAEALRNIRIQNRDQIERLQHQLRAIPAETLRPVIEAAIARRPKGGRTTELAAACLAEEAFRIEWAAMTALFTGA